MKTTPINIAEPSFDHTEIEMLQACLNSKWVTQGPMTARFEELLAATHGVTQVMACTSATSALHLSTMALGLGAGDEMIVPAFTWITSANAAEYVGAKAVFVDVDLNTFNIDPAAIEAAITPRTRAIMAVHLFGLSAPMMEINAIAKKHGLAVIEDAACAIGTTYQGRPVGGLGDLGCFSFHPRKVITTGEGGAVTTNSPELAEKVRSLRNHGGTGPPDAALEPHGPWTMGTFGMLGYNLRMSDIQAAVGVAQLAKLSMLLDDRKRTASYYCEALRDAGDIALPLAGDVTGHTYQSFVIRVKEGGRQRRNTIMAAMAAEGLQTRPGTHAVHRLGYYRDKYMLSAEAFPNAVLAEDTTITLPIVPFMKPADHERVVRTLTAAL
ncbi:DegT/DnrJ/EryC1/StrS family aminotransferase [Polaromonas sp.]|uniref:DegT/DnrJ/EryC1/StrS family aminotransferase n=1 Tax=Polaromonas sp. TaxID=1869339 RepID=UPI003BAB7A23